MCNRREWKRLEGSRTYMCMHDTNNNDNTDNQLTTMLQQSMKCHFLIPEWL